MLDSNWMHDASLEFSNIDTRNNLLDNDIYTPDNDTSMSRADRTNIGILSRSVVPETAESLVPKASNWWDCHHFQSNVYPDYEPVAHAPQDINSGVPAAADGHASFRSLALCGSLSSTTQAFPLANGQFLAVIDPTSDNGRIHRTSPIHCSAHESGCPTFKKHKRSEFLETGESVDGFEIFDRVKVLGLLFKYTHDLTMTQMENIAEDINCSLAYVFNAYDQHRKAAKYGYEQPGEELAANSSVYGCIDQFPVATRAIPDISVRPVTSLVGDITGQRSQSESDQDYFNQSYQCEEPDCNKSFSRQGDLNRHSKKHRPPEYPCKFPGCGKMYYRKDKLRQHWETEHRDNQQPSDLSSSRPRRDRDQDGNSRSNRPHIGGASRNSGENQNNANQLPKNSNSDNLDDSSSGQTCCSHNWSSRDSESDISLSTDDEIEMNTLESFSRSKRLCHQTTLKARDVIDSVGVDVESWKMTKQDPRRRCHSAKLLEPCPRKRGRHEMRVRGKRLTAKFDGCRTRLTRMIEITTACAYTKSQICPQDHIEPETCIDEYPEEDLNSERSQKGPCHHGRGVHFDTMHLRSQICKYEKIQDRVRIQPSFAQPALDAPIVKSAQLQEAAISEVETNTIHPTSDPTTITANDLGLGRWTPYQDEADEGYETPDPDNGIVS